MYNIITIIIVLIAIIIYYQIISILSQKDYLSIGPLSCWMSLDAFSSFGAACQSNLAWHPDSSQSSEASSPQTCDVALAKPHYLVAEHPTVNLLIIRVNMGD